MKQNDYMMKSYSYTRESRNDTLLVVTQTIIGLLIAATLLILWNLQTRSRWKKIRRAQMENLRYGAAELAEKHPLELRDMLVNARSVQTINQAYLDNSHIRDEDRTRAQELQNTTEQQIEQLRVAIDEAAKNRGNQGLVTPSRR